MYESMAKYIVLFCSFILFHLPGTVESAGQEIEPDIDVVWSSSAGSKMEVFYAQRKDGVWLDPVQVSDDYYDNMYPVIDRDSSGRRWIFWTAYDNKTMELRYTAGQEEDWQASETLETDRQTNMSPSVVVDPEDRVWVTWSANDGGLDDIMYAYYQDGSWSAPALVHAENEVADLLPVIDIDQAGAPVITWRVLEDGETLTVKSRWIEGEFSEPEIQKIEKEVEEEEADLLELPFYVKNSSMIFIRRY